MFDIASILTDLNIEYEDRGDNSFGIILTFLTEENMVVEFPTIVYEWEYEYEWEDEPEISHLRFIVLPYVQKPIDGFSEILLEKLLQFNFDMAQVSFLIDSDGDLGLSLDVNTEGLNQKKVDFSLRLLGGYAQLHYETILAYAS